MTNKNYEDYLPQGESINREKTPIEKAIDRAIEACKNPAVRQIIVDGVVILDKDDMKLVQMDDGFIYLDGRFHIDEYGNVTGSRMVSGRGILNGYRIQVEDSKIIKDTGKVCYNEIKEV